MGPRVYDVGTRMPAMRLPVAMMEFRVYDVGTRMSEMRVLVPKMGASLPETDPPIPEMGLLETGQDVSREPRARARPNPAAGGR
jgi:hypothetical protein